MMTWVSSSRGWLVTMLALLALIVAGCQGGQARPSQPAPTPLLLSQTPQSTPVESTRAPTRTAAATAAAANPPRPPITPTAAATTPVPAVRLMGLGLRSELALRAAPETAAPLILTIKGSQLLWAEGRSADGRWLRVAFGAPPAQAWVARADVKVFGDVETLPAEGGAAAASPPAAVAAPAAAMTGRVLSGPLNVRRGPGVDQPVIGQLATGAAVMVSGRSRQGDWLAVAWPGGAGWVAARYVEVSGEPAALPVLAEQTSSVPAGGAAAAAGLAGKIAFQTATGGDIYLVNADGTGLRRIAAGLDPAFAADGMRLAYARWDAPHGIFVLDLRTGTEERVATANRPRSPTWSADGSRLVFSHLVRATACRQTPFGCMEEDALRQLFGGQECMQTPQGRFCIGDFPLSQADETGLAQITLADRSWLDLSASAVAQAAAWRPGKEEILYRGKGGLDITAAGQAPRALVADASMGSPAWSPDGQRIAVQAYLHNHSDLFLLDASGKTQARLTAPATSFERPANNVAPAGLPTANPFCSSPTATAPGACIG